jgi:hypothetical protein
MRRLAFAMLLALALPLAAQDKPKLEPLPEPPPPQPGFNFDAAADQPQVTISRGGKQTIEEITTPAGKKIVRVTQPDGSGYELREDIGDGSAAGNAQFDTGLRVPLWTIYSF